MARKVTTGLLLWAFSIAAMLAAPTFGQAACSLSSPLQSKADSAINSLVRKANGSDTKLRKLMSALSELERKYSRNEQAVCLIGYLRTGIQKEIDGNSGVGDIFGALDSVANSSDSPVSSSSNSSGNSPSSTSGNSSSNASSSNSSNTSSSNSSTNTSGTTRNTTGNSSSTSGNSSSSNSSSTSSSSTSANRFDEYEANWRSRLDPNKTVCDATQTYTAPSSSQGNNFVAQGDCSKAQEIVASKCGPDSSTSYKINGDEAFWLGGGVMYPNSYNVVGGTSGSYSCENGRILYKCSLRAFKCSMKASTSTPVTWKRCGWLGATQYHCAGSGPARGEQISCPVAPPIARKVWQNVSLTLLNPVGTCPSNGDESCTCTYNAATSVPNWQENSWSAAAIPSTGTSGQTSGNSSSTSQTSGAASVSVTKSSGMWLTLTVNNIGQNAKQCIAPGINAACTPSDQLSQGGGWTYYPSTFSWKFDASVAGIAEPGQYYTLRYSGDGGKTASTSVSVSK